MSVPAASPLDPLTLTVGVIGTGAMGGGTVEALVRAGLRTVARDIRADAQARAVAAGALPAASPAALARLCDAVIILVVDAPQVEAVLFGADGAAAALAPGSVVLVSSTVDPAFPAALAPRLAERGIALLDAPVSGGPAKAAAGTMTMMVSGDPGAQARMAPMLARITGRLFDLGPRPGDASTAKIVNNLLAGANLAAAAEALAIADRAGLDLNAIADVIGASSGGSWIFADRVPRVLGGDRGAAGRRRGVRADRACGVRRRARSRLWRGGRCDPRHPRPRARRRPLSPGARHRARAAMSTSMKR
jgi:3-hydroxyisobutyrate dehydrogenase